MIRNEAEYKEAVQRIVAEEARIDAQREKLQAAKMSSAHMKRALDPLVSFTSNCAKRSRATSA